VAGSTATIAETLNGKISNLGDAFDNLFNTVGTKGSGFLSGTIDVLTAAVNGFSELLTAGEDLIRQQALKNLGAQGENFGEVITEVAKNYERAGKSAEQARVLAEGFLAQEARDNIRQYSADLEEVARQLDAWKKVSGVGGQIADAFGFGKVDELKKEYAAIEGNLKLYQQQLAIIEKTGDFAEKKTEKTVQANDKIAEALKKINNEYEVAGVKAKVFGETGTLAFERMDILRRGIENLIGSGLRPGNAALDAMISRLTRLAQASQNAVPALSQLTPVTSIPTFNTQTRDFSGLPGLDKVMADTRAQIEANKGLFNSFGDEVAASLNNATMQLQSGFQSAAGAIATGVGQMVGQLASGEQVTGKQIVGFMGRIATQLGQGMIAIGTPLTFVPATSAAGLQYLLGGAALIAAGTALSAGNTPGASGRGGSRTAFTGVQSGFSGTSSGSATPLNTNMAAPSALQGSANFTVTVVGELIARGSDLVAVINREQQLTRRTGG
jgi:hypothetical protein